jgi:hypothetical protein
MAGLKITRKQTKPIAAPSSVYGSGFDEETVNELLLRTKAVLDIDSKRDTISRLPDELIVYIAAQMNSGAEVNALARTNRRLFLCVDDYLYQRDAQRPTAWALNRAINRGRERTVAKAVQAGAKITIEMLTIPSCSNDTDVLMVKHLLDLGKIDRCSVNSQGWTSLMHAVAVGHDAFVKSHLDSYPAEIGSRSRDKYGTTLLERAANRRHESTARLLLESDGVDPEAKNNFGKTALTEAVAAGHESIVKLLLEPGKVNVNSRDHKDVLMTPALWGRLSIFKLLLDAGGYVSVIRRPKEGACRHFYGRQRWDTSVSYGY